MPLRTLPDAAASHKSSCTMGSATHWPGGSSEEKLLEEAKKSPRSQWLQRILDDLAITAI
jgi:hypothetical protein